MPSFEVDEAQRLMDDLIERALAGEEIIVTREGSPVAFLVSLDRQKRRFGLDRGRFVVPYDFDAPLSDEEIDWYS